MMLRDSWRSFLVGIALGLIFSGLYIFFWANFSSAAERELPSAWIGQAQWGRQWDGDTLWVSAPDQKPVKVRLAWVDAPEKGQPWGPAAAEYVHQQIKGNVTIWVVKRRGFYGRPIVAVVLPDGRWLNHELARQGLAWVACRANCPLARRLADEARAAGRGLWSDPAPVKPADYRREKKEKSK